MVALASGQQLTALEISSILAKTIGGGVLCGGVVALGALLLAGRTDDHLVEIAVTTVAAFGSFLLAEHFGWSGVLATIRRSVLWDWLRGRIQPEKSALARLAGFLKRVGYL